MSLSLAATSEVGIYHITGVRTLIQLVFVCSLCEIRGIHFNTVLHVEYSVFLMTCVVDH